MAKKIKIGYEIGTGKEIFISPAHLIVTGLTQLSGKTTTIEALIKRSGLRAIIFKTKIGEKSFSEGTEIPPFFKDRSDYEFVKSLMEAYSKEKLFLEKGTLMRLCKGSASLLEIKKKVDDVLLGKLRSIELEIHTRLQHNLENLIPQIQYANLSKVLTVYEGINIMNLERFSEEVQSLIIQSVADEVLKTMKDVILVIPEAWKFVPQKYNNPCKRTVEAYIRQGAVNNNFIWIDSQDMAGVDKIPLKQISTWILGYQSERNEVKHTLDQISLPKKSKPKEEEIMTLRKGQFFVSSYDGVKKVYVQPIWIEDEIAEKVSKGIIDVDTLQKPESLTPYAVKQSTVPSASSGVEIRFDDSKLRKEILELRSDFFNKIQEQQSFLQKMAEKIYQVETSKPITSDINTDEIVSKVLQKLPTQPLQPSMNVNEIVKKVIELMPKNMNGSAVYTVSPLEKIKKDFLEQSKSKILGIISSLDEEQKKILKFVESQQRGCTISMIIDKGLLLLATSGGIRDRVSKKLIEMNTCGVIRRDKNSSAYPALKELIKSYLGTHEATEQEVEQVYLHILAEML